MGIRLFVRTSPDAASIAALGAYMARLSSVRGYKWVPAADAHITLKFFGEVDTAMVTRVDTELSRIGGSRPFEIASGPAAGFPRGLDRPNVVVLSVAEGGRELARLASSVSRAAKLIGAADDSRPYRAHITLGRARGRDQELPSEARELLASPPALRWRCERYALTKSELSPSGPIYTDLAEYEL